MVPMAVIVDNFCSLIQCTSMHIQETVMEDDYEDKYGGDQNYYEVELEMNILLFVN